MAHIFVSYSRRNKDYCRRLVEHLLERGFDVWVDDRIDYGDNWWMVIVEAIQTSAAVIVLMTPEAKTSRWVQREVALTEQWKKPVFPVLLEGENWEWFVLTQYADALDGSLPKGDFYERLKEVITPRSEAGRRVTQTVAPVAPVVAEGKPVASTVRLSPLVAIGGLVAAALIIIGIIAFANGNYGANTPTQGALQNTAGAVVTEEMTETPATHTAQPTATEAEPTASPTNVPPSAVPPTDTPSAPARFPTAPSNVRDPAVILFDSDLGGERHLTINEYYWGRGGGGGPLTFGTAAYYGAWSPDASQVAFYRYPEETLYLINADGSDERPLAPAAPGVPAWSPDGEQIAFVAPDLQLSILNLENSKITHPIETLVNSTRLAWSPDGTQIAYLAQPDGNQRVYVFDLNDPQSVAPLTDQDEWASDMAWSPDGTRMVFSMTVGGFDQDSEIFILNLDGQITQLTDNTADDGMPTWSPDGEWIAFATNRDGNWEIYVMDTAGENVDNVSYLTESDEFSPDWKPDN